MTEKELKELEKFAKENGYNDELKDIYFKRSYWQKLRIRMRSNFRLATNILLVIGTFAIALKIAPIAEVYQEKIYLLNI